jgi:hypothetical protein
VLAGLVRPNAMQAGVEIGRGHLASVKRHRQGITELRSARIYLVSFARRVGDGDSDNL